MSDKYIVVMMFSFKIFYFNKLVLQCRTINVTFKLFLLKEISCIDKGSICLVIRYKVDTQ